MALLRSFFGKEEEKRVPLATPVHPKVVPADWVPIGDLVAQFRDFAKNLHVKFENRFIPDQKGRLVQEFKIPPQAPLSPPQAPPKLKRDAEGMLCRVRESDGALIPPIPPQSRKADSVIKPTNTVYRELLGAGMEPGRDRDITFVAFRRDDQQEMGEIGFRVEQIGEAYYARKSTVEKLRRYNEKAHAPARLREEGVDPAKILECYQIIREKYYLKPPHPEVLGPILQVSVIRNFPFHVQVIFGSQDGQKKDDKIVFADLLWEELKPVRFDPERFRDPGIRKKQEIGRKPEWSKSNITTVRGLFMVAGYDVEIDEDHRTLTTRARFNEGSKDPQAEKLWNFANNIWSSLCQANPDEAERVIKDAYKTRQQAGTIAPGGK